MALSLLQIVQYSSFEWLLIGVKQSWQYFMILRVELDILRIFKVNHSTDYRIPHEMKTTIEK